MKRGKKQRRTSTVVIGNKSAGFPASAEDEPAELVKTVTVLHLESMNNGIPIFRTVVISAHRVLHTMRYRNRGVEKSFHRVRVHQYKRRGVVGGS